MPDSEQGAAAHAGSVRFPRRSIDLSDTTFCPACFEALEGAVCPACELDLRHPAAAELAAVSAQAAGLIERRWELIGRIRYDSPVAVQRRAAQSAGQPVAGQPVAAQRIGTEAGQASVGITPPGTAVPPALRRPAGGPPPPPGTPAASAHAAQAPRRSSVQVLLLVVGISLVSVAAVFFLLYAFTNYGIIGRSLVIGAVTVAAFAVASLLRRGRLTTTAEGIAVFAVVLVYLDAFAVRANDLFGSGTSDPLLYWGVALVLSSLGFVLWHRLSLLRVPNIVAFAVFAPGVALTVGGIAAPLDDATRLFLALLAAGTAGLVHPLAGRLARRAASTPPTIPPADAPARLPERIVAFSAASVALALAFAAAFAVAPGVDAAVLPALAGVALVSAIHAAVLVRAPRRSPLLRGAAAGFASLAALALSTGVVTAAYRALPLGTAMVVSAAGSTLILLVLLYPAPRAARSWSARAAVIAAAAVAAVAVALPATQALALTAQTALISLGGAWRQGLLESVAPASASTVGAVAALAAVVVLVAGFAVVTALTARAGGRRDAPIGGAPLRGGLLSGGLLWGGCAVLVAAVPLLGAGWAVGAGWLLMAAVALALVLVGRPALRSAVPPLAATAGVAGALGYAASWASTDSWMAGSLAAIVLLLAARRVRLPGAAATPAESAVPGSRAGAPAAGPPAGARSATPPPPPAPGWTTPAAATAAENGAAALRPQPAPLPRYGGPPVASAPTSTGTFADGTALVRAALLGVAVVLAFVAAAASAYLPHFLSGSVDTVTAALDSLRLVSILAVLLLVAAALPLRRGLSSADRHTLFALGALAATLGLALGWLLLAVDPPFRPLLAEPLTGLLLSAATLGAVLAWLLPRANRDFPVERRVAGFAAAPVVYLLVDSLARLALPDTAELSLVAVIAALLVAAAALAAAVVRPAALPRVAVDSGVAAVGAAGLLAATAGGSGLEWLALLLAAVAALLTAVSPDGLVNAPSPRKHLGWAALGLATAALWWLLAAESVRAVEAWVLPVSGVLLLVALASWRGARSADRAGTGTGTGTAGSPRAGHGVDAAGGSAAGTDNPAHRASARLLLAALLVALVPIGIAGVDGSSTRALTVGLVSAALLLAGSLLPGTGPTRRYLDVLAGAGLSGALAAGLPRAAVELPGVGVEGLAADAWAVALAAVLVLAAVAQAAIRDGHARARTAAARAALLGAMSVVLIVALLGFGDPQLGAARAVVVALAFSLLYLLASAVARPLLGPAIRWTSLVFAVVAVGQAVRLDVVDPVELLTLPLALALLASGGVALARVPEATSWTTLGAGLGVLLLPSLLLTDGDRPVWRLVAVGVVALLVFVSGVRLRLQAPVLVGAVVVLVHAATTFAPQIRAVYELTEWWVWAGIGGIPIIVYAALAERSVRTTRTVVLTIGSLR